MTVIIGRRELLAALGGAAAAWSLAARAQQAGMRRVGIVMTFAKGDSEGEARIRAFKQELAKLGWTDGGNIQFDERWPADNMDLVRSHAASLVASNPDIIVTSGGRIVPVLMRLTRSIPIVLPGATDPVGVGWAQNLARPGGNVTGLSGQATDLAGKRLELLREVVPRLRRLAIMFNVGYPSAVLEMGEVQAAARALGIEVALLEVRRAEDIAPAYDLPVEQPTKFEMVFNLITAKAIGLDVPPTLLARADEVIE